MSEKSADKRVMLIRHAQTDWNAAGRWQGHADPPLSAEGQVQARLLGERLRGESAVALVCSDLQRAIQTANPVAQALGLELVQDPRLRELDVGSWSGQTRAQIQERDPEGLKAFESGAPDVRPGGGETRSAIRRRSREAVEDWLGRIEAGRLVVVTHLGVIMALLPGHELANASAVEVSAEDILTRREKFDAKASAAAL